MNDIEKNVGEMKELLSETGHAREDLLPVKDERSNASKPRRHEKLRFGQV